MVITYRMMMAIKIKVLAKVFMPINLLIHWSLQNFHGVGSYGIPEDPPWHPCIKYEYFP